VWLPKGSFRTLKTELRRVVLGLEGMLKGGDQMEEGF